jgi:glycosyltransferase involved in cell wall biosynthesis
MKKIPKNIVIIGSGPLPNDISGIREAAGLRTHQFIKQNSQAGHYSTLICIHNNHNFQKELKTSKNQYKNTNTIRLHRQDPLLKQKIRKIIKQVTPDVIFGINTFSAFISSQVCPVDTSLWTDLNGWILAEAQARGFSEKTNTHFANSWRQEKSILQRSDRISTVSTAQKFTTIGEMACNGLTPQENFQKNIVHSIPNCTDTFDTDKTNKQADRPDNVDNLIKNKRTQNLFKGIKTPEESQIISWIGGYNNWVDEKTLFLSVDNAMSTCPNLYFVSTGGAIKDVSNQVFSNFLKLIENSPHKKRYIFLGWIDTMDMHKIYKESDIGINCDFDCIETQTGARNRLNEMLKFELPIITTGGSEIAQNLEKYKAGECVHNGDHTEITKQIIYFVNLIQDKEDKAKLSEYKKYKTNCRYVHREIYNIDKIMTPVLDFIDKPDIRNKKQIKLNSVLNFSKNIIWYLQKNGIKKTFYKFIQKFL